MQGEANRAGTNSPKRKTNALQNFLGGGLGPILLRATAGSFGLRLAGMGLSFLVGVQLARGLGPEGYGIYGVAMSVISLLAIPTEFGLPHLVTREVAAAQVVRQWGRLRGVLSWAEKTSMLFFLVIASAFLVWLIPSGLAVGSSLNATILVGLTVIPLVALGKIRAAALRGLQHIVKGQLGDVLIRPLVLSLLLLLVTILSNNLTPALAMGMGSVAAGIAFCLTAIILRRAMPDDAMASVAETNSRAWWSAALPMALSEGMRILQSHLVILFLAGLTAMSVVGSYRVASSTALMVAAPVSMLSVIAAPIIASLFASNDGARLRRLLAVTALGMFCGASIMALPFFIAGGWLISKVFGVAYLSALPALRVICIGMILSSLFGACAALLNMTGNQRCVTRASAVSLLLLCASSPLLILSLGMIGAAISAALSLVVWSVIMWLDARRILELDSSVFGFLKAGI